MTEAAGPTGSPEVLDFEALLRPIPGDLPAGADPRMDRSPQSLYFQVRDARRLAREAERAAASQEESGAPAGADWSSVRDLATRLLSEQAKDLDAAAWLIEALVREHGFAGFRDGCRLVRGLVENFWDGLHPMPDEEGLDTRLAQFSGLNGVDSEGTLSSPLRALPLTQSAELGPFGQWHHAQAADLEKVTSDEERDRRTRAGIPTLETFRRAVQQTPITFYRTLRSDLEAARAEFDRMTSALDAKAGHASPPSSNLRACLDEVAAAFADATRGLALDAPGAAGGGAPADEAAGGEAGPAGAASGPMVPGRIASRDDAFVLLERVAEYFRNTEPHSPLSYTLEQAVRWGRMPLPDLLTELIQDEGVRESFFRLAGIRKAEPPAGTDPAQS
jgi:type VI secretion system protein ImpA